MCSGLMNVNATASARRQCHQHVAGKTAVRGVHAHLPVDLEPLAHDVRQVVENLGQVAAGIALDEDGGHEETHVENRDAHRHFIQRVTKRQAVVLLVERLLELRTDRFRQFVGDHAERRLKRLSGADGAGQQVERLGKLLFEAFQPAGPAIHQPGHRRGTSRERGERGGEPLGHEPRHDHADNDGRGETHDDHTAGRRPHA